MKFSIIVPIYNCEAYLRECLDSVMNQTFKDWECICVDDGSTDLSGDIADEYAARDLRFRVIHKKNGGEGSARNAGLDVVRGEWVYYLDSDDILNHQTIEMCNRGIEMYPDTDLSAIRMIQYPDGKHPEWHKDAEPTWEMIDISQKVDARSLHIPVWAMAYRFTVVKNILFTDLKVGADRVYVIEVIEKAQKVVLCDYIGYGYRTRLGSIVNSKMSAEKFLADLRQRMVMYSAFTSRNKEYSQNFINQFAKDFIEYMGYCFFQMDKQDQITSIEEWSNAMMKASEYERWKAWPRFVMKVCAKCNSIYSYWLLCYLPYWLKSHGLNRELIVRNNKNPDRSSSILDLSKVIMTFKRSLKL